MSRRIGFLFLLVLALFAAKPYIQGNLSGLSVRTVAFKHPAGGDFDNKSIVIALSGSTSHSVSWTVTGPADLLLELVYSDSSGGTFYATPAEFFTDLPNPYTIDGNDAIPVSIPVAPKVRLSVSGAVTGTILWSDS